MDRVTTVSSTTSTLCLFVIALAAAALLVLIVLHFLPTGVNPISEAVSDYGVGEYRNFYRLAAFWLGASGLTLAIAMGRSIFPKPTMTILLLLLFATARWAITLYPTDLPGEEPTPVGRAHFVLAATAFASIALAALFFGGAVKHDPLWHPHVTLLNGLAVAVAATAAATGLTRSLIATQIFGLVERALYLAMIAWLIAVAAVLI